MQLQLYKKIIPNLPMENKDLIKVYWTSNGSFLEYHSDNTCIGWKRLLSGYYIKLSQDWVPGEVVHCQLMAPLQMQPVSEQELIDEKLVQQWYECTTKRDT